MTPPAPIASTGACIVIPAHNRRETTLRCLQRLQEGGDLDRLRVIVVDDGSTDGTAAAVRARFSTVTLLTGDGNLWWTGAITRGMRHAVELGAEHVLWLNDDTLPEPGALSFLLEESRRSDSITGGVCFLPGESTPAYGGVRKTWWDLKRLGNPGAATVACDALHGNLVCVPATTIRTIGLPDAENLPHAGGDFDYTLRARRAGIPVLLVGGARAHGQANVSLNYRSWLLSDVPVLEWWRQLGRRGSHLNLRAQWRFHRRHWGTVGALHVIALLARLATVTAIRLVIPLPVLRKLWGKKSSAWQHEQRHRAPG